MKFINPSERIKILCFDHAIKDVWERSMQECNIAVQFIKADQTNISFKNNPMLLINPEFNLFAAITEVAANNGKSKLFILSMDERWKEATNKINSFYVPLQTHPMEVARFLVEKLNLPTYSNNQSYAFSFFNL